MHNYKIIYHKKFFIYYLLIFVLFECSPAKPEECQNFEDKIVEAKKYFPIYNEIELNYSLRTSFITNYNKFSKEEKNLVADKIILLALLDRNEWYVFAGLKECFVFWINLEPDRFIELIDGGAIAKEQGIWKTD